MVQLTKLENALAQAPSADEIAAMWDRVDKSKLVQYKLKVELGQEVNDLIA